jgi:hypothetical protein
MFNKRLVFVILLVIIEPAVATTATPMDITILAEHKALEDTNRRHILEGVIWQLADGLDPASRLSLSLFAGKPHEIESLQPVTEATGQRLTNALNGLSQAGIQRNTAAALEKAIYQLRTTGREQAQKRILVLGDGMVDTGDALGDRELSQWIRQELSIDRWKLLSSL